MTSAGESVSVGSTHTFVALLLRDLRVLRRDMIGFALRVVMQPLLFVFLFAYLLPRTGLTSTGGTTFATVLVPGMVASAMLFSGLSAVVGPLIMELSPAREIDDRLLAPLPVWGLGLEKLTFGAAQAVVAGLVVLPVTLLLHSRGQSPNVSFDRWPLLIVVTLLGAVLAAALGMLVGTLVNPRRVSVLLSVVTVPMTLLGCVYYPWHSLAGVRWLQFTVLANPLVYLSEGLRAALTPGESHMPLWLCLTVLTTAVISGVGLGVASFIRRAVL